MNRADPDDDYDGDDHYENDGEERDEFEFEGEEGVDARALMPRQLTRLIQRRDLREADFVAASAALMLAFARVAAEDCGRRDCREHGICQKPPLACAMRRLADIYDWDRDMDMGPRAQMYEAIKADPANAVAAIRRHTPHLAPQMLVIPLRKKSG